MSRDLAVDLALDSDPIGAELLPLHGATSEHEDFIDVFCRPCQRWIPVLEDHANADAALAHHLSLYHPLRPVVEEPLGDHHECADCPESFSVDDEAAVRHSMTGHRVMFVAGEPEESAG